MITLLFFVGIAFGSFGGILMKLASSSMPEAHIGSFSEAAHFFIKMFTNPTMLAGVGLYFISTLIWMYLLTKLPISYVQPILALTYVLTPILAIFVLHEPIPTIRWIGVLVIVFGVYIVAKS